jgi:hypothetical protein
VVPELYVINEPAVRLLRLPPNETPEIVEFCSFPFSIAAPDAISLLVIELERFNLLYAIDALFDISIFAIVPSIIIPEEITEESLVEMRLPPVVGRVKVPEAVAAAATVVTPDIDPLKPTPVPPNKELVNVLFDNA